MHKALKWVPLLGLCLALTMTGCASARSEPTDNPPTTPGRTEALQPGASTHTMNVGGHERSFITYRPAARPPTAGYPVVVVLHGGLGSARQAERSYGWDVQAEKQGFIVVYPDGLGHTWNAGGGCCGVPAQKNIDDVAFITSVLEQTATLVDVDPARRYATGMSNGAMLSFRLACETSLFSAIAPVAGTQLVPCTQAPPTSLLEIHGAADTKVRPDGKPGNGPGHIDGPPLKTVMDQWRTRDHCAASRTTTSGKVTTTTATCPKDRDVESIMIAGAGHQWPGSTSPGYPGADQPSPALNATDTIGKFFARH